MKRSDRLQEMIALLGADGVIGLVMDAAEKWGIVGAIDRYRLPLLATMALLQGKPYTEPERITCGAKTRTGAPCKRKPVPGKKRCPNHGGLNRSDRTPQGRINAGKGLREWHAARRAAKAVESR
jgi:hypothetical protein